MGEIELQETGEVQFRRALFTFLKECPLLPDTVSVKYGEAENNTISIISQKGEQKYTKKYISGACEIRFPFLLRYLTVPAADSDRINAEELLADVADWLCRTEVYPAFSDGRKIVTMEAGNVYPVKKEEDGTVIYEVTMNMMYTKGSK